MHNSLMVTKTRSIEVDVETADALEQEAQARGLSLSDFLASLVEPDLPPDLKEMRDKGLGPWSPEALAEDQREIEEYERTGIAIPLEDMMAWVESWGTDNELPPPEPRKL